MTTTDEWGFLGNFYKHPAKGGNWEPVAEIDGVNNRRRVVF